MLNNSELLKQIDHHIHELAVNIGERPTGSAANRSAENYIRQVFVRNNIQVELQTFDCIDWQKDETTLSVGATEVYVEPSPYSLPCDVQADIEIIKNISQLENADLSGKIAVLCDELTQEP